MTRDENSIEDVESKWWQPGDLVDICDVEDGGGTVGGWFKGKIVCVTRETRPQAIVAGEDKLTYLVSYDAFSRVTTKLHSRFSDPVSDSF